MTRPARAAAAARCSYATAEGKGPLPPVQVTRRHGWGRVGEDQDNNASRPVSVSFKMQQQHAQRCADPCLSLNIFILRGWYFLKIVYSVPKYLFYNMYIVATLATQKSFSYRRMKTGRAHFKMQ